MTDETGFLAAIDERPNDRALLRVYADWLEEQGRTAEALPPRVAGQLRWVGDLRPIEQAAGLPAGTLDKLATPKLLPGEGAIGWARRVLAWLADNRATVRRRAGYLAMIAAAREKAAAGDAAALLLLPQGRQAIRLLASGRLSRRLDEQATTYTSSRQAIAEAKRIMVAREERRAARQVAEAARAGTAGRIHALYVHKLQGRAHKMADIASSPLTSGGSGAAHSATTQLAQARCPAMV